MGERSVGMADQVCLHPIDGAPVGFSISRGAFAMVQSVKMLPLIFARATIDLLYPPLCALCLIRLNRFEQIVCDSCRDGLLPNHTWRCRLCGATERGDPPPRGRPCPLCPPPEARYHGILSSVRYTGLSRRCIHLFKYDRRMEMGRFMADIMVARLAEPLLALEKRIEWIVPVPLHWRRRLWRGFNQSRVLADRLAQALEMPVFDVLRRVKHTRMQSVVPKQKRQENVRNAFEVRADASRPLPGILLVDDVVTTAHTVMECSRVLSEAGSPQIWIASFARAPQPTSSLSPTPAPALHCLPDSLPGLERRK